MKQRTRKTEVMLLEYLKLSKKIYFLLIFLN